MALIQFRKAKLGAKNMARLERVNELIAEYAEMGYVLTLRQLYYRLVAGGVIQNTSSEYARLIHVMTEGRMGGLVDWDGIEDRVRKPSRAYYNDSVQDAIDDAVRSFRLDRQIGQKNHIELWVEKDAISNILRTKTNHYGIYLMVNRGFSSTTAMYDSYKRMQLAIEGGQDAHILYLGDHDPSGLCMALTDIPDRLNDSFGVDVKVKHIGITKAQIKEYNPPPNPAKITDSRAAWYIKNFGKISWEVDALEPQVLHELIDKEVTALMDMDMFDALVAQEQGGKDELKKMPKHKSKVKKLKKDLKDTDEVLNKVSGELSETTSKIGILETDISEKLSKINELVSVVDASDKRISSLESIEEELTSKYNTELTKISNIKSKLELIDVRRDSKEDEVQYQSRIRSELESLYQGL